MCRKLLTSTVRWPACLIGLAISISDGASLRAAEVSPPPGVKAKTQVPLKAKGVQSPAVKAATNRVKTPTSTPDETMALATDRPANRTPRMERPTVMPTYRPDGYITSRQGTFTIARQEGDAPDQPDIAPLQNLPSFDTGDQPDQPDQGPFGGLSPDLSSIGREVFLQAGAGNADASSAPALNATTKADLGESLAQDVQSLQVQRRSMLSQAPFIRGYKNGQIYTQADGQYFVPARQDLDTILSKLDPGTVQDVIVINGPYSVQYGPGFSFIDVVMLPTPRNQRAQYRSNGSYIANGDQWYGRETVSGGGRDFGYRVSYGSRKGSDYFAGNGTKIPGSYASQDFFGDFGYDISPEQRVEFGYRRLDQTNLEYPAQIFDISALVADAYNLRFIDESAAAPWTRLTLQGWYNRTRFAGNTFNGSKRSIEFPVVNRIESAVAAANVPPIPPAEVNFSGYTDGDVTSTGSRGMATFGELDDLNLTMGTDLRVLSQNIQEQFFLTDLGSVPASRIDPANQSIFTNLPRSHMVNPGLFSEIALPWTSFFTTRLGTRVDFVNTYAQTADLRGLRTGTPYTGSLAGVSASTDVLNQNDLLFSGYITNDLGITDAWTANVGFGYAQRPPTLTDRYADGLFLGIIQSGFSRVIGDPNLDKERNYQIDIGMRGNYENWRGYARAYNAWVLDYITYRADLVRDPTGARLLRSTNTPLATLSGFEVYNDFDVNPWVTPFADMAFVYGRDQTIGQALPSIPPLQSRAGVRFHDPNGGRRWGLEAFARMVGNQRHIGQLRQGDFNDRFNVVPVEVASPGFTTWHLRGYWNVRRNLHLVSGIDNLFDRNYIEHLSLRLPAQPGFGGSAVLSPGFTPYMNLEWIY